MAVSALATLAFLQTCLAYGTGARPGWAGGIDGARKDFFFTELSRTDGVRVVAVVLLAARELRVLCRTSRVPG